MFKKWIQNTRKPEGFGGRLMIKSMNLGHSPLSKWGVSHVKTERDFHVLDIGCGGGKNIQRWLELCPDGMVKGIDYSIESVNASKKLNKEAINEGRCEIIEANVLEMPFDEGTFDLVSAFETVYFWPEIERAFQGVYKILKPGGKFLIVNEASGNTAEKWANRIEGMKAYSMEDLSGLLKKAGFEISLTDSKKIGWFLLLATKTV